MQIKADTLTVILVGSFAAGAWAMDWNSERLAAKAAAAVPDDIAMCQDSEDVRTLFDVRPDGPKVTTYCFQGTRYQVAHTSRAISAPAAVQ